VTVIGATNDSPADDALHAFFDRFLLRVPVHPVGDDAFVALLKLDAEASGGVAPLSERERAAVTAAARRVTVGKAAETACLKLRGWLAEQRIVVSDRRWRQWIGLMKVAAATEGRREIDAFDLWLAPHVAGGSPEDVSHIASWFEAELIGAVPHDAPWLAHAVAAFEQQLEIEQCARDDPDAANAAGKLALARSLGGEDERAMLRLVSGTLEDTLRRRYSVAHVAARVAQVEEVIAHARELHATATSSEQALAAHLEGRLWLPAALAARMLAAHAHTRVVLASLIERLERTCAGFADLPVDAEAAGTQPAPVPIRAPLSA
jgi:MoxR-like ATPase